MTKKSSKFIKSILNQAREVLKIEADSIIELMDGLDNGFVKAIELILSSKGRVIITAIGKSGHIGRKIAATMISTGTPALYMHPSEALHGDLGIINKKDILLVLSNSGESEEIINLIPLIRKIGSKIIAITGRQDSTLARQSDIIIPIKIKKEADPLNLAPTASTTATLALGDALAVVLLSERNFSVKDFAKFHPGGSLGRALMEVKEIMHIGDANPIIQENQSLKEALFIITSKALGMVNVIDKQGRLSGIITDGDVRRIFMKADIKLDDLFKEPVKNIMTKNPLVIYWDTLCLDAVKIMEDNPKHRLVTVLPVLNEKNKPVGTIHIHDLIRRGFSFQQMI